jgi:hypothetical protein
LFSKKRILTLLLLIAALQILRRQAFKNVRSAGEPLDVDAAKREILNEALKMWSKDKRLVAPRDALKLVLTDLDYPPEVVNFKSI